MGLIMGPKNLGDVGSFGWGMSEPQKHARPHHVLTREFGRSSSNRMGVSRVPKRFGTLDLPFIQGRI